MDKNIITTEQQENGPVYKDNTGWHLNFDFTLDSVIIIGLLTFAVWRKFLRPLLVEKFYWIINPFEEERKIPILLAQIQAVAHAKCVMIGSFHNGEVDNRGYHLKRYSVVYHWCDETLNQKYLPANLRVADLNPIIHKVFNTDKWIHLHANKDTDEATLEYLKENNISAASMRLVRLGNIPIGLLTIQYGSQETERIIEMQGCYGCAALEELFNQLQNLLKRRFQHSLDNANIITRFFKN